MRRVIGRRRSQEAEEETVWISFSDLMTALVTVFMLAAVVLVYSLTEEQSELQKAQAEVELAQSRVQAFDTMVGTLGESEEFRASLVTEMVSQLQSNGIEATTNTESSVIRIPVELLGFASGNHEIEDQYRENSLLIGQTLADTLLREDNYLELDTIFIEGHTDNVPMPGVYGENWGLSTNRAISLWTLWEDNLSVNLGDLSNTSGSPLFSVSGYADTRPVNPDQDSAEGREQNRRIDIRFVERKLTEQDLVELRAATGIGEE